MGIVKMPPGVPEATYRPHASLPMMSFLHGKKKKPKAAGRLHGDRILNYRDVYGSGKGGGKRG